VVPVRLLEVQLVIEPEQIPLAFVLNDARMIAARAAVRRHDIALIFPRAGRTVAHGIPDAFGAAGGGVCVVAATFTLPHPWGLLVMKGIRLAGLFPNQTVPGDLTGKGNHILVQFDIPKVRVSPI